MMNSKDEEAELYLSGEECESFPASSVFSSIDEISEFFKGGATGYSPTKKQNCLHGMCLQTDDWNMRPFQVDQLSTTYFHKILQIPEGELMFDSAVVMRNIRHTWEKVASVSC
ncbi:hypothetical protein [Alkalihalobacillus sp. AL-G]|uniref:hypothetical protein n=1 Tax=Alkalihalobacillus sp. AL-G TaxID=2926399 RepID=UPI00272C632E|nr:hypothetical protein [Alkalihalobacillus sp. AL-G]WLD93027.1 hypothetical protein MOJ78_18820 [Alkalihalobacillus sp. AL-G]